MTTPINCIISFADLLKMGPADCGEVPDLIAHSAYQLKFQVRDLLDRQLMDNTRFELALTQADMTDLIQKAVDIVQV